MIFELKFTFQAADDFATLKNSAHLEKRLKGVKKALGYLQMNPRHPALNTHKYNSRQGGCSW